MLRKYFFIFYPYLGKWSNLIEEFSKLGWNHRVVFCFWMLWVSEGRTFSSLNIYIYPFRSFFHEVESPLLLGFFVSKSCCGLRQFLAPHPTWRLVVLRGSEQTLLQPAEGWGHLFERVCFPTELTAKGSFKRGNPPIGTCSFSHCPDANLCFSDMCRRIAQKQLGAKSLPCHKSTSTSQWVN